MKVNYLLDGLYVICEFSDSGNLVSSSGSVSQPYEFVGREGYYREGELYLLGQRWYDSSVGRFISPSPFLPLDYREIINPYIYVIDNPIFWIDPYGLDRKKPNWNTITIGIIEIGAGLINIGFGVGTTILVPEISPVAGPVLAGVFYEGVTVGTIGLIEVINGIYGNPPISGEFPFIFIAPPFVYVVPPPKMIPQIIQQIIKDFNQKPPDTKNCK